MGVPLPVGDDVGLQHGGIVGGTGAGGAHEELDGGIGRRRGAVADHHVLGGLIQGGHGIVEGILARGGNDAVIVLDLGREATVTALLLVEDLRGQHVGRDGGVEGGGLLGQEVKGVGGLGRLLVLVLIMVVSGFLDGRRDHREGQRSHRADHKDGQNDGQDGYELFAFCVHSQ